MKKRIIIILSAFCLVFLSLFLIEQRQVEKYKQKASIYQADTHALMQSLETYTTKDSLNVARVSALSLKIDEYERLRQGDMETIKTLQTKGRDIERVTTAKTATENTFQANVKDSIIIYKELRDSVYITRTDTIQCINLTDKWYTINGCWNNNIFEGTITNYDELLVVVTGKRKRFLGFLWKTNKIKNRKVDVVSRNPHTKIQDIEYIEIL